MMMIEKEVYGCERLAHVCERSQRQRRVRVLDQERRVHHRHLLQAQRQM